MKRAKIPVAMTIAGSDSGGGAGIQADLKTFAALGVHGVSAITCLTAQNPAGVLAIQAAKSALVQSQIEAIFAELQPAAIKTGMLYSSEIITTVVQSLERLPKVALVVDPVMVATSGARLLKPQAVKALLQTLLPRAALVTPNLEEAAILVEHPIATVEEVRSAAREIQARYGCAALVKGGHLQNAPQAIDFFFDGQEELLLEAPFLKGLSTHGTGCTYSAAIAGYLALGCSLAMAVEMAKNYITQAIAQSVRIGRHTALQWFWNE